MNLEITPQPSNSKIVNLFARPLIAMGMFKPQGNLIGFKLFLMYCMLILIILIFGAMAIGKFPVSTIYFHTLMTSGGLLVAVILIIVPYFIFCQTKLDRNKKLKISDILSTIALTAVLGIPAFLGVFFFREFIKDDFGFLREEKIVEVERVDLDVSFFYDPEILPVFPIVYGYEVKVKGEDSLYSIGEYDPYTKELRENGPGIYRILFLPHSDIILRAERSEW